MEDKIFYDKADAMFEDKLKYEERYVIRIKDVAQNLVLENLNYDKMLRFDANLNIYKLKEDGSWALVENPNFKTIVVEK